MKRNWITFACLLSVTFAMGQKVAGKIKFEQGQSLNVTLQMKTTIAQQAMVVFICRVTFSDPANENYHCSAGNGPGY